MSHKGSWSRVQDHTAYGDTYNSIYRKTKIVDQPEAPTNTDPEPPKQVDNQSTDHEHTES